MKLWDYIKTGMMRNSSQVICENNATMAFDDVVVWAEEFAKKLKGIKCCAILCGSEMAASMALLACFAAGVTALPLSVRYGEIHCNKILDAISPDAVITDEDGEFKIRKISASGYIQPDKHPALIMCTSGTTGKPKGAMLSEDNIIANVKDICRYFAINRSDTILISRPLYHCAVLTGEFLTALIKGTKIRFYSQSFNPTKMLEMIRGFDITAFCGTPTLLSMMARFNRTTQNVSLKHICISGECMDKETGLFIAKSFENSQIYHIYGLTEASPRVCYLPPDLFVKYPDCVGVPLKSVAIKIVKEDGTVAKNGETGMLWVKGNNVMLGYYNEPQKTKRVLSNGWLCTGDLALINEAGLLKIKGRKDNLIIKSGMNIYPSEIEAAVKMDSRVKEVLIYGYENKFGTQIGMKIVGDFSSASEVKTMCSEYLPSFQIPLSIEIVEELPKNGSGKIIRGAKNA